MDLKKKIRAVLTAAPTLKKARVAKVKTLGERVLVYLVSSSFIGKTPLQRQRLVSKAIRGADALSPEDIGRIGLVRTYTPSMYNRIVKARRERLEKNDRTKKDD